MLGKPDPMMMPGFSTETRFTAYLALRNTTDAPMDVALLLNYMTGATPVSRSLPTQRLRAFESRKVNLYSILDEAGMKLFNGSINLGFSYTGQGGDLIVATGSVDQTGSYVFEVRPQGIGQSIGRISGYWSVENGNDAMFSAWNPTDEPEDITATLYYGDGSGTYHLPIHLAPRASASVDVAMLVRDKMPDIDGKIIPSNIRDGSASFDTAEKDPAAYDGKKLVTAVISGAVFNVAEATCGMVCTYCNGYNNWVIIPGTIYDAVGTSSSAIAQATDSYGNKQTMSGGSWSSSNTGIMTVSSGNTQGISTGQVSINDLFNSVLVYQGQFCVNESMPDNCPTGSAGPSGPGNVTPRIDALSPSRGLIGTAFDVIILGSGFGSNPVVNAQTGISVTINPNSQSCTNSNGTICAHFSVASNAPGGNNAITVSVTGSSPSPPKNFFVQIPTKLVRLTSTGCPSGYCALTLTSSTGGKVMRADGMVVFINQCGVFRNVTYSLLDQDNPAQAIDGTYILRETFSSYSSSYGGTIPATVNNAITPGGILDDIQYLGKTLPSCPGSNDNESFNQSMAIVIGSQVYNMTMVNNISRGYFSGTAKVDITVKTP